MIKRSQGWILTLGLLTALPCWGQALPMDQVETLAESQTWLRLLHYQRVFPLWTRGSLVDGKDFFFSPDGDTDPKAELLATVSAFSKDLKIGRKKQHPQCAFPARYQFLKKQLDLKTKDVDCPELNEWLQRFHPESATLVFSTAYPNNPGSMFGHTFLRINAKQDKNGNQRKLDLLDHGISYAALVGDNENNMIYIAFGLFGGYMGQFSILPYYAKVQEYNHSESRDIWEYNLNLNREETLRLLRHAWEIETNSYFRYFFFDENCAYHLLALLEVAKPEWDLTGYFVHVIPAETVKKLSRIPDAIRSIKFRPSIRKKLFHRFEKLNSLEKDLFFKIVNHQEKPEKVKNPLTLEALSSYLAYQKQKLKADAPAELKTLHEEVLLRRSELGPAPIDDQPILKEEDFPKHRPDLSHHPYRLGIKGGILRGAGPKELSQGFQELNFRFAYHDLMNHDRGYPRFSHIDFPGFKIRYADGDKKLYLEELRIAAITSLSPFSFLEKSKSWKFDLRWTTPKDYACDHCHVLQIEGGAGATLPVFSETNLVYLLGLLNMEAGGSLDDHFRTGPKIQSGFLTNPWPFYKIHLRYDLSFPLLRPNRFNLVQRWWWEQSFAVNQALDIRTSLSRLIPHRGSRGSFLEASLGMNLYF